MGACDQLQRLPQVMAGHCQQRRQETALDRVIRISAQRIGNRPRAMAKVRCSRPEELNDLHYRGSESSFSGKPARRSRLTALRPALRHLESYAAGADESL